MTVRCIINENQSGEDMIFINSKRTKVAVIGAGFVGSSAAYALALKGYCHELVLIDVNEERAAGEAEDIRNALPWFSDMTIEARDYSGIKDCDAILITAGVNRKPGQSRLDLAGQNVKIARDVANEIQKHYTGGVLLVVANPVDVLTQKFTEWMNLPPGRVFGTGTIQDTARFISLLSRKLDISVSSIGAYLVGEHGDSHVPLWSKATIYGISLAEYCCQRSIEMGAEQKASIIKETSRMGAEIIRRKGATHYGIGGAVAYLSDSIINDRLMALPVSVMLTGQYGIARVSLSLPSVIGKNGVIQILDPAMNPEEAELFRKSAGIIRETLNDLPPM